jgi:AraC-like DNA-binding protein
MDSLKHIKEHLKDQSIITDEITLTKLCIATNNHKHRSFISNNLLNIVYKGKKIIHSIDGTIEVKTGEAFFITRGEYMMSEVIGKEDYESLAIFFDHDKARSILSQLPFKLHNTSKNSQNIFKFELNSDIQNTIDTLQNYLQTKPKFADELITLKLKELIFLILSTPLKENFINFCQNLTKDKNDLKSFMENHFEKDLTLEEFARLSGRSLSGFKSEFKSLFNETPMRWILNKKLEKGKFLIQELGYNVGDAAITAGFKTHAHFSRLYKKQYNTTPSFTDK